MSGTISATAAMTEATAALKAAGFYEKVEAGYFKSERQIARAWAKIVYPIGVKHGVELGARIYSLEGGIFAVGGVYSDGHKTRVTPARSYGVGHGEWVAWVHTHPPAVGGHKLSERGNGSLWLFTQPDGQSVYVTNSTISGDGAMDGDISWALITGKTVYSYGGLNPLLRSFNPSAFERLPAPPVGYSRFACQYTSPPQC